jgi:O-antigen/teichoic acid export membrane protein
MTLKEKTFSAVRWTTVAIGIKAMFQFLQMVILARLLSPGDFGLMALIMSVIMFALQFVDMGISNAIVHHQIISNNERNSLYWLNFLSGVVLSALLMLGSPWIADFYHEPRLHALLLLISPYFIIVATAQQLRVMAEKELLFSKIALLELTSSTVGFVTMLVLALNHYGVYSLVYGFLANALTSSLLMWIFLSHGWRPHFRLQAKEVKKFLIFGSYTIANNLVSTVNSSADIFLGGRIIGTAALGIYSLPRDLALNIASVINPIVTRVGLPVMAKSQHDIKLLKSIYLKTILMTASINFPIYFGLFTFAPEIVVVVFGERWLDSIPLLRMLAFWGLLRSVGNPVGSLIFAVGRADLAFKWNFSWTLIMLPSIWFGLQYGAAGLSKTLLFLAVFGQIPNWYFLVRPLCGAKFIEYFAKIFRPLLAAMMSSVLGYACVYALADNIYRLLLGCGAGLVFYLIISYWLNRSWLIAMSELLFVKFRKSAVPG